MKLGPPRVTPHLLNAMSVEGFHCQDTLCDSSHALALPMCSSRPNYLNECLAQVLAVQAA